jgi:hypothetical protein
MFKIFSTVPRSLTLAPLPDFSPPAPERAIPRRPPVADPSLSLHARLLATRSAPPALELAGPGARWPWRWYVANARDVRILDEAVTRLRAAVGPAALLHESVRALSFLFASALTRLLVPCRSTDCQPGRSLRFVTALLLRDFPAAVLLAHPPLMQTLVALLPHEAEARSAVRVLLDGLAAGAREQRSATWARYGLDMVRGERDREREREKERERKREERERECVCVCIRACA